MSASTPTPAMRRRAAQREAAARQLREDLLHHLWTKFPIHCVTLGEAQARVCVEHVVTRGKVHGLTSLASLRGYADLMLFMGAGFDDDPQLAWAGAELRRSKSIPALLSLAAGELSKIAGAQGEHYRRALMWVRSKPFDELCASYGRDGDRGLRAWLRAVWEQKYDTLGEHGITRLLTDAQARSSAHFRAGAHGLLTNEWLMVYSGLMLLLGSAFAADPFHPWAAPALAEAAEHPHNSASSLHAAALRELERFLTLDRIRRRV